jgi:hypothetical protein
LVQATGLLHAPELLHVSTPLPEHFVLEGVQTPVQTPETQAWLVHEAAVTHVPELPHDWGLLPEHCLPPGEQVPVHAPETHVWPEQETAAPQAPVPVQLCTPLSAEHCD